VKLNSADFQKGGFSKEESARVAGWLAGLGVDLLEISGGTYEQMALLGRGEPSAERQAASTRRREAYFLEYARDIRSAARDLPIMVTGGFRTPTLMREVVATGEVDVIGIARPFCVAPDVAAQVLSAGLSALPAPEKELRLGPGVFGPSSSNRTLRTLNGQAEVAWFYSQIIALSEGREPDLSLGVWRALMTHVAREIGMARRRSFQRSAGALPASSEPRVGN